MKTFEQYSEQFDGAEKLPEPLEIWNACDAEYKKELHDIQLRAEVAEGKLRDANKDLAWAVNTIIGSPGSDFDDFEEAQKIRERIGS